MISYSSVKVKTISSYDKLRRYIPSFLIDDEVICKLKENIGLRCDEIQIEYPYYDSDYLSTYYIHYAQKLRRYERKCCRLHILKDQEYYGYIVLRPTVPGTKLGRTLIKPEILLREKAYLTLYEFKAHIMGETMSDIRSFPWKSQETDISVCAHTATWAVLRYFGNKFKNYMDTTIGAVVQVTKNDWGRKTPSIGLNPTQVSDIFKEYDFSPLILQCEKEVDDKFCDELMAYIESGLPMVGFLYPRKHAIAIIGHGLLDTDILDDEISVSNIIDSEINVVPHSRLIRDFYVMDDNYFPYKKMRIGWPSSNSDVEYGSAELKYCVVPLYHQMQFGYSEVYSRFQMWMKENIMNWETPCVSRIYITTANSLKEEAGKSKDMNKELVTLILGLSLPKFVWCIDLATFEEYKKGLTSGRIIIDTTASTLDDEPWILRHDKNRVDYVDIDAEDGYVVSTNYFSKELNISPYKLYKNNLKECNVL